MSDVVLLIAIILFVWLMIKSDPSQPDDHYDDVRIPNEDEDEEIFHHPVTGYSGNRKNMDAYIINREKKLKNK